MRKILTISIIAFTIFALPTYVLAQGNQQGQGTRQQAVSGKKGIGTAIQNLNRVNERNNNPETGEQIRSMVQNHQNVQARTMTALHKMNQRNQTLKFLIGPDYKNAGQVRSDVVGLRNDIRKLEQIKQGSLPEDVEDIQSAIDELQFEANGLDSQLAEELSGFSLFGWLAKLLAD